MDRYGGRTAYRIYSVFIAVVIFLYVAMQLVARQADKRRDCDMGYKLLSENENSKENSNEK